MHAFNLTGTAGRLLLKVQFPIVSECGLCCVVSLFVSLICKRTTRLRQVDKEGKTTRPIKKKGQITMTEKGGDALRVAKKRSRKKGVVGVMDSRTSAVRMHFRLTTFTDHPGSAGAGDLVYVLQGKAGGVEIWRGSENHELVRSWDAVLARGLGSTRMVTVHQSKCAAWMRARWFSISPSAASGCVSMYARQGLQHYVQARKFGASATSEFTTRAGRVFSALGLDGAGELGNKDDVGDVVAAIMKKFTATELKAEWHTNMDTTYKQQGKQAVIEAMLAHGCARDPLTPVPMLTLTLTPMLTC